MSGRHFPRHVKRPCVRVPSCAQDAGAETVASLTKMNVGGDVKTGGI